MNGNETIVDHGSRLEGLATRHSRRLLRCRCRHHRWVGEATASLDNRSQAKIQHLLETKYKGTKTVIAVIHRLDMASSYDRIIVMKAGSIVEQGTYDDLMERQGAFYELVHKH